MLTALSKKFMVRSFQKTRYLYRDIPNPEQLNTPGIYIHVPFCHSRCGFCPFYKELYNQEKKDAYLETLLTEIGESPLPSKSAWLYIGGGTPNVLAPAELDRIIKMVNSRTQVNQKGIELFPPLLSADIIRQLSALGFTKISLGIESLSGKVLHTTSRPGTEWSRLSEYINLAQELGLWINLDIMTGLPQQTGTDFLHDIKKLSHSPASQITLYPYMQIGHTDSPVSMSDRQQFQLIEKASDILLHNGFKRKGIWVFARGNNIYDTSAEELVNDYIGFGPAAFSTYGKWKVVNPELDVWLKQRNPRNGFVAMKTPDSDQWRRFARMIYEGRLHTRDDLPKYINQYIKLLVSFGYSIDGVLTTKGTMFAHAITKTVVESLPYPLQKPQVIENIESYNIVKQKILTARV